MKKVLLYTNELDLRKSRDLAKRAETDINNFVSMISRELKRNLTKDEKLLIIKDGPGFLEKTLDFTLPNAPEALKFSAMGIDIDTIKKAWNARSWGKFEFKQDSKGDFVLTEPQPIFESHKKYATPKQLEVLEQSKTLADALNVASEQGLNVSHGYAGKHTNPLYRIRETFNVLTFDEKENKLIPNLENIAYGIKE